MQYSMFLSRPRSHLHLQLQPHLQPRPAFLARRRARNPVGAVWTLALLFGLSASAVCAAELPPQYPAMRSAIASKAMLTASARAAERIVAVGAYGNIVYSAPAPDGKGVEWRQAQVPTQRLLTAVTFVDAKQGWAGGHDALILHTRDGGESWEIQYQDPMPNGDVPKPVLGIEFSDAENGFAVGAFSLLLATTDGGKTWKSVDTAPLYDLLEAQGLEPEPNFYSIVKLGDEFLVVGELGTLLRYRPTRPAGEQWRIIPSPYEGTFFGARQFSSGDLFVYGLRGHLFRSADLGETWTKIETNTIANINDLIELSSPQFLAVADGGNVLKLQSHSPVLTAEKAPYPGFSNLMSAQQLADGSLILFGSMGAQPFSVDN